VTHGELLALYNQVRRERYEQPLRVRLGLVTIKKSQSDQAQALAQVVRQRAAAGEDFARLAERYSHDPMASKGGDWGLVTQGALKEKAVEGALFGLAAGQVSPVLETADAFCIVKALERQEARTVPFTEVQGALEDEIRDRKYNEMVSKYIQQLYGRSYVRVMLDNL
jgi:parvulin-like peptidyl-prolyl isomerase